ncbi:HAD superfamily, subfamily IIIB acid phosphatase isoform X2 [Tasmannia lanceolata]
MIFYKINGLDFEYMNLWGPTKYLLPLVGKVAFCIVTLFGSAPRSYSSRGIESMFSMMRALWEIFLVMLISIFSKTVDAKPSSRISNTANNSYCLSWRVAVEANNIRGWRTVPVQCLHYVENYMLGGQYERDIDMVVEQISAYMKDIIPANDCKDAWILDVDDTCISNLIYYKGKRFGGDPFDSAGYKAWAQKGSCPAIPAILQLFKKLIEGGFKVFLLTGRDEELLGQITTENLHNQGFIGYERLILRSPAYRGQRAVPFKSEMRKQLAVEGYRIRGNVGDQWSDLMGDYLGDRTFKLPNPMYFVP